VVVAATNWRRVPQCRAWQMLFATSQEAQGLADIARYVTEYVYEYINSEMRDSYKVRWITGREHYLSGLPQPSTSTRFTTSASISPRTAATALRCARAAVGSPLRGEGAGSSMPSNSHSALKVARVRARLSRRRSLGASGAVGHSPPPVSRNTAPRDAPVSSASTSARSDIGMRARAACAISA